MEELSEKERAFLIGLEKLTRKTGIKIGGCGCCGSPFLSEVGETALAVAAGYGRGYNDEIRWIDPEDDFAWESYSESIVKKE